MDEKNEKPNILFIMADQHRFDCIGAYGNSEIKTPGIDHIARDGITFDQSFVTAPVCTPSRYSTITGLHVHEHLAQTNRSTIQPQLDTFPKILKRAGYRTKAVGKMHFYPTYQDVGFDEMELAEQAGKGRFEDDYHRYLKEHGLIDANDMMDQVRDYRMEAPKNYWEQLGAMESNLPEEHHSTSWIGRKALETIEGWSEEGNMMMVSFIKPHHPFDPPHPWNEMYNPDGLTLLPGWTEECLPRDLDKHPGFFPHDQLSEDSVKHVMAHYYGTISHIDSYVSQMIELLKQKNMYDNTLIIYTSDHGEYMGFHHMLVKQNHMYDPLIKVPLIIKQPNNKGKGTRSEKMVSNVDLSVTFAHFAGVKHSEDMRGHDILSAGEGRQFVLAEGWIGSEYMIRSRTHKLILSRDEQSSLFFDLESDPYEMNNLYHREEYAEQVQYYMNKLSRMVLFDYPGPVYMDETVDKIKQSNVPQADMKETMMQYSEGKMKDYMGEGGTL